MKALFRIFLLIFLGLLISCPAPNAPTDPELSSDKKIHSFSFKADANTALSNDYICSISGTEITATLPHGTELGSLIASFTI